MAQVAIWGQRPQQRHVQLDPAKLAAYGISLEQVKDVTADALDAGLLRYSDGAVVGTGGFVESGGQRLNVRHLQAIEEPEELAEVVVVQRGGRTLRLGDLGRVVEDAPPLWGDAVINDGPGLMLVVQKFRGANTMKVTREIETAIDQMRPGLPSIEIDTTIFRPATFIETAVDNLTTALILGCLLVIAILLAFLFEWRTALISLVAIPLSLVAALLVLDICRAHDQRDDPRGARGLGRRRRRRRDHRRREHRPPAAPGARRWQRQVDRGRRARRHRRGAIGDHLRDADRRWSP